MLLSDRYNFLFLANPKCASSSVEAEWRNYSHISIRSTKLGKHISYREVQKHLKFVFKRTERPIESFFRFGIVRDPIDKAVSWFNYRARKCSTPPTKGDAIKDFATSVAAQAEKGGNNRGQHRFFSDQEGNLGTDYLIALPKLSEELPRLRNALGIKARKKSAKSHLNASSSLITRDDLPSDVIRTLTQMYHEDLQLYQAAVKGAFGTPEEAVRKKKRSR